MNFGEALEEALRGRKIRRIGWNGKRQYVVYMPQMILQTEELNERTRPHLPADYDENLIVGGYFVMVVPQDGWWLWQPGWVASQADMLADDWEVGRW